MRLLKVVESGRKHVGFRSLSEVNKVAASIRVPSPKAVKPKTLLERLDQAEDGYNIANTLLATLDHQYVECPDYPTVKNYCLKLKAKLKKTRLEILKELSNKTTPPKDFVQKFKPLMKADSTFIFELNGSVYGYAFFKSLKDEESYEYKDYWMCLSCIDGTYYFNFLPLFRTPDTFPKDLEVGKSVTSILKRRGIHL